VKVEYVNPFITATINTFQTMLNVRLTAEKPALKTLPFPTFDVSGIIGISGDALGSIALSFPRLVALRVVTKILGTTVKIIGPEVSDAVGELTNIVAGNAKKDLGDLHISISLPNVIIGKQHQISNPRGAQSFIVPFKCELGGLALDICLKTE